MGFTQRLLLSLLCLWPALAQARVQITAGNGIVFDFEDTGGGELRGPAALNGWPQLCVRVCQDCDTPCAVGETYNAAGVASTPELAALQRVTAPVALAGLTVQRKIYVGPLNNPALANGFIRYLDLLTNPGAEPITVAVRLGTSGAGNARVGHGVESTIWRTQDDDASLEATDRWFLVDDALAEGGVQSLSVLVHGAGAQQPPSRVEQGFPIQGADALAWDFREVTVPPGETLTFLTVLVVEPRRVDALAEIAQMLTMSSELLFGLTDQDRAAVFNFDIDPANPSPVADAGGPYNANENDQVQLSAARSVDPEDALALTYAWDLDGDGEFDDSNDPNAIVRFSDDGTYQLQVQVTDPLGKSDIDTARVQIRNVAPIISAVQTDSPIDEGEDLTVDIIVLEPGADALVFDFDWNGDGQDDELAVGSNRVTHRYFEDGTYDVRVRVTDDDGGQNESTFRVVVQNVAPRVFDVVTNAPQLEGSLVSIQIVAQDPGLDPVTFSWDFEGDGVWDEEGVDLDRVEHVYPDNGQYSVRVRLRDDDGAETIDEILIPVINASPTIVAVRNNGPVFEGSPARITVEATDPGTDTITYSFDLDNDGAFEVADQLEAERTHVFRDDGRFLVGVRVRDEDNGRSLGNTTVEVRNADPVGRLVLPDFVDEGQRFDVTVEATDPGDDVLRYDWDLDGDGIYDIEDTNLTTVANVVQNEGNYVVTCRVRDGDGGVLVLSGPVFVRNVEPIAQVIVDGPVDEGRETRVRCEALDAGADNLTYAFDFEDDGIIDIEGLQIGDIPHAWADQGSYIVRCIVDDGRTLSSFFERVEVANVAPTVALASDSPQNEGGSTLLTVNVFDPGDDTLTFSWDLDGDGITEVSGEPEFERVLPALDNGATVVTLIVRDEDGGESQAQTRVVVRNVPPTIPEIAIALTATEGEPFNYVVPAEDPAGPADPLTFQLLDPPAGVEIDPVIGLVLWVPNYENYLASPVRLRVQVDDGDGGLDNHEFSVDVYPRDVDQDNLPDTWESAQCEDGTPCLDADADDDGDGLSNLQEFERGTDPNDYDGPPEPAPIAPADGQNLMVAIPALEIDPNDGETPNPDLSFEFVIYNDLEATQVTLSSGVVPRGEGETVVWSPPQGVLFEDQTYWWHARAILGDTRSPWTPIWEFTINETNVPPETPRLRSPSDGSTLMVANPVLECEPVIDADGDEVVYRFRIYRRTGEIFSNGEGAIGEDGFVRFVIRESLAEDATFLWDVVAVDRPRNELSEPSERWSFTVNGMNAAPTAPTFLEPSVGGLLAANTPTLRVGGSTDPDGPTLSYFVRVRNVDASSGMVVGDPVVSSDALTPDEAGEATWTPTLALSENENYAFEAWANDGLVDSPITTLSVFVSGEDEPPPAPRLSAPGDGAVVVQEEGNIVYLTWDAVLDPEGANVRYIVRLCDVDGDCAELEPVPDVARTLTDTLQGTTYSWKVKAVDETGNEGPYSDEWSFTVANSGGSTPAAGCGCRTNGNTPTPGWLIAGLAALVLRRRRSLRH
jgi:MYXO-CTERM domain-containing protein